MKTIKLFISIITIFLIVNMDKTFAAESDSFVSKEWVNVYATEELPNDKFWAQMSYIYASGNISFCIEPGVGIDYSSYSSTTDFKSFNIDDETKEYLELVSYYGYNYPGNQNLNYYLATQELIWRKMGVLFVEFRTERNYGGEVINIENEKKFILEKINKHYLKPSFDNNNYEVIIGDTLELIDENNVLNDYEVLDENSYIKDNKLYIKVSDLGNYSIKLKRKKHINSDSFIYYHSNSQNLVSLGLTNDIISKINIDSSELKGVIEVNKTGNVYKSIKDTEVRPLDKVKFGIYADIDITSNDKLYKKGELIEIIETSTEGKATSSKLELGNYCIKELETKVGYMIDSNEYCFSLKDSDRVGNTSYQNLQINNELITGSIKFTKLGEIINRIENNKFIYAYKFLNDVEYGLYTGENIYNTFGELIMEKDQLIDIYKTNLNGEVYIDKLPFGKYYIKEISNENQYEIDSNSYYFEINSNNYNLVNVGDNNIFINYLKKSNIEIIKKDIDTDNLLDGVKFNLLDDTDNLLMELTTNKGIIHINDLPYGKYYIKEVQALDNYIIDNNKYEIDNTINNNLKMTFYNKENVLPKTTNYLYNTNLLGYSLILTGGILYAFYKRKYN